MIKASQELVYTNNSPDDLNHVFFHLYANAFEPDSYLDKFRKGNKMKTIFREDEKKKNLEINSISSEGESLDTEIDNTVMKVFLNEPLKSGETIKFNIDFESHFGGDENTGNVRRRMKTQLNLETNIIMVFTGIQEFQYMIVNLVGQLINILERSFMGTLDVLMLN